MGLATGKRCHPLCLQGPEIGRSRPSCGVLRSANLRKNRQDSDMAAVIKLDAPLASLPSAALAAGSPEQFELALALSDFAPQDCATVFAVISRIIEIELTEGEAAAVEALERTLAQLRTQTGEA